MVDYVLLSDVVDIIEQRLVGFRRRAAIVDPFERVGHVDGVGRVFGAVVDVAASMERGATQQIQHQRRYHLRVPQRAICRLFGQLHGRRRRRRLQHLFLQFLR